MDNLTALYQLKIIGLEEMAVCLVFQFSRRSTVSKINIPNSVNCKVLAEVSMKIRVFCGMTPCRLVNS